MIAWYPGTVSSIASTSSDTYDKYFIYTVTPDNASTLGFFNNRIKVAVHQSVSAPQDAISQGDRVIVGVPTATLKLSNSYDVSSLDYYALTAVGSTTTAYTYYRFTKVNYSSGNASWEPSRYLTEYALTSLKTELNLTTYSTSSSTYPAQVFCSSVAGDLSNISIAQQLLNDRTNFGILRGTQTYEPTMGYEYVRPFTDNFFKVTYHSDVKSWNYAIYWSNNTCGYALALLKDMQGQPIFTSQTYYNASATGAGNDNYGWAGFNALDCFIVKA